MVQFILSAYLELAAWNHPMVVYSRSVDENLLSPIRGGSESDRRTPSDGEKK